MSQIAHNKSNTHTQLEWGETTAWRKENRKREKKNKNKRFCQTDAKVYKASFCCVKEKRRLTCLAASLEQKRSSSRCCSAVRRPCSAHNTVTAHWHCETPPCGDRIWGQCWCWMWRKNVRGLFCFHTITKSVFLNAWHSSPVTQTDK